MITLEDYNKKVRKNVLFSFIPSILFLVFAFILLFREEDFISTFILILGFLSLILGTFSILKYIRLDQSMKLYSSDIFEGVIFLFLGFVAILKNEMLANLLTILLGIYFMFKSARSLQICMNFQQYFHKNKWLYLMVPSVIGIVIGAFIILNPLEGRVAITKVLAYSIILSEVIHILQNCAILFSLRKNDEIE